MALACGSEHMNVLAPAGTTPVPSGGIPVSAVAVLSGSTATQVNFGAGAVNGFPVGCLIAVDVDYQQQTGYVGSGIAGAYVTSAAAVQQDANYVRRVTFNVARVAEVTSTAVLLEQPLLAGVPTGASAQVVVAFVDREGGAFFQEWSALFVAEQESGGRVCFYYPRLSPDPSPASRVAGATSANTDLYTARMSATAGTGSFAAGASELGSSTSRFVREDYAAVAKPVWGISLRASFVALPYTDPNDGQTVLCYRSYFPAPMAAVY